VTRRASLPGVDELFRSSKSAAAETESDGARTQDTDLQIVKEADPLGVEAPQLQVVESPVEEAPAPPAPPAPPPPATPPAPAAVRVAAPVAVPAPAQAPAAPAQAPAADPDEGRRPRHEEKVTFYCTGTDLTRIERARLALRADHKLASDRGRIVRAALAEILDDFERRGADSALVARLRLREGPADK
jgi:hypothetical protein